MSGNAIWTPDGVQRIDGKTPDKVELAKGVGEWLRQFSDVAAHLQLGLHCGRCGADVVGRNADSDRVFTATCGCREFIWTNRDYVPPRNTH